MQPRFVSSGIARSRGRRKSIEAEQLEQRTLLSGYGLTILSTFNLLDTSRPKGQIVENGNGDFFFMASAGDDASDPEAVWELAKGSGTPTMVAEFDASLGTTVESGLAIDSNGDLFGTNEENDDSGDGDGYVWEIVSGSSMITTLASFAGGVNGENPDQSHLLIDGNGDLFGTTLRGGGPDEDGVVWELPAGSSTITALASFNNTIDQAFINEPIGVAMDGNGDLFGTIPSSLTTAGALGSVWELPAGGSTINVVAAFNGTDGVDPGGVLVVDSSGDIFGETENGGIGFSDNNPLSGAGTIFEIPSGSNSITTLASFDGTTKYGPIKGLETDSNGDLFGVASSGAVGTESPDMLYELPKGASTVTTLYTFSSSGTAGFSSFTWPLTDAAGDIFTMSSLAIGEFSPGGGGGGSGTGSLSGTLSGKLASSVIAGQKVNITQHLTITNSGTGTASGNVTATLFLSTSTTVDSNSIQLASTGKSVKLKPKAKLSFNFRVPTISTSVTDTTYYLVAEITDPSSNVTDAASSGTVAVVAPTIDLSGAFSKQPMPAKHGKTAMTFSVSNGGNIAAVGSLTYSLESSPDGLLSDATVLTTPIKKINIRPGKSTKIMVSELLPPGTYFLVVQLDPDDVFSDVDLTNNVFATLATV